MSKVSSAANSVLHHEALRTTHSTQDARNHDAAFAQLAQQCRDATALREQGEFNITPTEERLIKQQVNLPLT